MECQTDFPAKYGNQGIASLQLQKGAKRPDSAVKGLDNQLQNAGCLPCGGQPEGDIVAMAKTTTTIEQAGRALYGPVWQSALAHALGLNVRTVQRWAAGEQGITPENWERIGELLRARRAELAAAIAHLPN